MAQIEIPDDVLLQLFAGDHFERLKRLEIKMTELSGAVQAQTAAINELAERISALDAGALQEQVNSLTAALDEERAAHVALQELFTADEVADDAALAEANQRVNDATAAADAARAAVDSATTDIVNGIQGVQANTTRLTELAQPAPPTP